MNFSEWLEKRKNQNGQEEEKTTTSQPTADKKPTFGQWLGQSKADDVDQDYIDTFFADANSFLGSVEDEYNGLGWGTASSAYDSRNSTWSDLSMRSSAIRTWLNNNKSTLDADTYSKLSSTLDSIDESGASIVDAFKKSKDYFAQFASEVEYKDATKLYELYSMSSDELLPHLSGEDKIAYTTSTGQNVTWQQLYDEKRLEEEMNTVKGQSDFEEYSKAGASVANPTWKAAQAPLSIGGWTPFGKGDEIHNMVTFAEENHMIARAISAGQAMSSQSSPLVQLVWRIQEYMDEDEKAVYNYYIGIGDKAKADEYLESLDLQGRVERKSLESIMLYAAKDPVGSSVISVATSLASGVEFIADSIKYASTGELDTNLMSQMTSAIRGTVSDKVNWEIGNWDAFDFVYNTGMSWLDSMASMGIFKQGGGIALGLSAAASAVNDALDRGMSNGDAFVNGLIAGFFECLFETISIGQFASLKEAFASGGKEILKNIAKSMGVNAFEEASTEIANTVYDMLANGDFSQYETNYRAYIASGMTPEEAKSKVRWESVGQVVESAASGALMGIASGALGSFKGRSKGAKEAEAAYGQTEADTRAFVQRALEINPDNALAKDILSQLDQGKKVSGLQLKILEMQSDETAIKGATKNRLAQLGATEDVEDIDAVASALTKQASGEDLTLAEKRAIKTSMYGERVSNELDPDNVGTGEYSNEWVENIGTFRVNAEAYNKGMLDQVRAIASHAKELDKGREATAVSDAVARAEDEAGKEFAVSEDGKTIITAEGSQNGKEVTIKGVASTEGGKLMLALDDGSTVDASNVSFGSQEEALMYEMVARMEVTPDTANEFLKRFNPTNESQTLEYFANVPLAYTYGLMGYEAGLANIGMSEVDKRTAYNRGRADAIVRASTATKTTRKKATQTKHGEIILDGVEYDESTATELQKANMVGIEMITKMSHLNVHAFSSFTDKDGKLKAYINGELRDAPNGYFQNGNDIYIDINAGDNLEGVMLHTMAHEITHYIKKWNAKGFKAIGDFLIAEFGKKGVPVHALLEAQKETKRKSYEKDGLPVPSEAKLTEEAFEELVADAMSTMLADPKAYEKLAKLKKKDRNLWQQLGDAIKSLLDKLKKLIGAYKGRTPDSAEAQYVMDFAPDVYERLQDLYLKAFVEADENYAAAVASGEFDLDGEETSHTFSQRSMVEGAGLKFIIGKDGTSYKVLDKKGKPVTEVTAEMIVDSPLGNLVTMAKNNGFLGTGKEATLAARKQYEFLAELVNMCIKYSDIAPVWEIAGSMMFSSVKSNSDTQYGLTVDFSTVCKKTQEIVDVMSATMVKLGRGLTRDEVENIVYEEVVNAEEPVPCHTCYVFARWMGIGGILQQVKDFQDKYASMSEESLLEVVADFKNKLKEWAYIPDRKGQLYSKFFDKNGEVLEGQVIAHIKSKADSKIRAATNALAKNAEARLQIQELEVLMEHQDEKEARKTAKKIESKKRRLKDVSTLESQIQEAEDLKAECEEYQWLMRVLMVETEDGLRRRTDEEYEPVPPEILFDLNKGAEFASNPKWASAWAYRTTKGANAGKAILPYSDARVGEAIQSIAQSSPKGIDIGLELNPFLNGDTEKRRKILESAIEKQARQNLLGGQRYQSTSDFRYEYGSDYLITFLEMQAIGAKVQLYTKVIEAVDFLATVGADVNLSVMPLGDGFVVLEDGTKKLVYSSVSGINAEAAIEKSHEYNNVQLILVGISDEHIRLALAGDEVTFVIPFHGSGNRVATIKNLMGMIKENLDLTKAHDYEKVQSDHVSPNQTAEQKAMWNLRVRIVKGEATELSPKEMALLEKNAFLKDLYRRFYIDENAEEYGVGLTEKQAGQIFPYEYWDKSLTYAEADKNGDRFLEYCATMGIIPRFSGKNSSGESVGYGDFTKDKGYWKLLIDRPMYDNEYDSNGNWIGYGKYHEQQRINCSNFQVKHIDPAYGTATYGDVMSKANDPKKVNAIRDAVIRRLETTYSERGSAAERDSASEARDLVSHIRGIVKERGSWRSSDLFSYVDEHPNLNFIDRIFNKDKTVKKDLEEFLNGIEDEETVDLFGWYMAQGYSDKDSGFDSKQWKTTYPYRGAVRTFQNAVKKRINDLRTAKVGGTNLGVKNGEVSFEEVKNLFYRLNSDKDIAAFADKVFATAELLGVNIRFANQVFAPGGRVSGDALGDMVELKTSYFNDTAVSDQRKASVILHEIIHTCTTYVLFPNKDFWGDVYDRKNPHFGRLSNAATRLNRIYYQIAGDSAFKGQYGIKDTMEMVAEFSNPEFVELLKKKSLWQQVLDFICELFGFTRGTSAYENAKICLDYILDNPDVTAYKQHALAARKAAHGVGKAFGSTVLEDGQVRYSDRSHAPTFYSHMGKVIDGIKTDKVGAGGVVPYLKGKGVKDEEIKWSGIEAWLQGKKSVTKAELQEFVAGSMLQIEEKTNVNSKLDTVRISDTELALTRDGEELLRFEWNEDEEAWGLDGSDAFFSDEEEILEAARQEYDATRWDKYRLDGGENYREIVFRLPNSSYFNRMMRVHWGEDAKGILAHARIQDMTTSDGKRMLFVEEIQSDWHNEGSKKGYENAEPPKWEVRHEKAPSGNEMAVRLYKNGEPTHHWMYEKSYEIEDDDWNVIGLQSDEEILKDFRRRWAEEDMGVPDAPFRTTYHEYVLKRLIRMAAEEGYDAIGWTPADIQSERWSDEYAEGYRIEYDQDIPKFLRKYGKKWGATVGKTDLDNVSENVTYVDGTGKEHGSIRRWFDSVTDAYSNKDLSVWMQLMGGEYKVTQDGSTMRIQHKETGELLDETLSVVEAPNTVWSMDIPDSMKDSVLHEGQPLYSERGTAQKKLASDAQHSDSTIRYSVRKEAPPKKTRKVYKLMKLGEDGNLYPLFIDGGSPVELGVWYNADSPSFEDLKGLPVGYHLVDLKTGKTIASRNQKPSKKEVMHADDNGRRWMYIKETEEGSSSATRAAKQYGGVPRFYYNLGINGSGSVTEYALRPGWHAGSLPVMEQIGNSAMRNIRADNFVWVEGEVSYDIDYQEEAESNPSGENDIPFHIPKDGAYIKGTSNFVTKGMTWYIAGAFKANRILGDREARAIVDDFNENIKDADAPMMRYDFPRANGRIFNAETMSLEGGNEYEVRHWERARDSQKQKELAPDDTMPTKFSERGTSVSTRSLLANALESVAANDIERKKLEQYKAKIALLEAAQRKLEEIRKEAQALRFTKGRTAEETARMRELDAEATRIANRISTYDKQLLSLESTAALKGVLEREKAMLRKRLAQKEKAAVKAQKEKAAATQRELLTRYQEARKKAVESRNKTATRHKIKDVVADLNKLLLNPTKEKHVPIGLQKVVALALDTINMDMMNAEERVAYYDALIAKAQSQEEIDSLLQKKAFFEYRGMNFKDRVDELSAAYAAFLKSDDPLVREAHNEAIEGLIERVASEVGDTSLKDMSLAQLEAVHDMYKAVLATVRNANKLFLEAKQKTITQASEDVKVEVDDVGGHRDRALKVMKGIKQFGWNLMKPVAAMKAIGSKTFAKLFDRVRSAEDTWAVDVREAKEFYDSVAEKYGYKKWDFKKRYTFKDKSGIEFSISLEQMLSLYAYSKRAQADEHLEVGGFIFDDAIEIVEKKHGIPLTYEVNDANPYRLGRDEIAAIIGELTDGQRGFVDEMQTYLSDVMGAKGNEVSLAMYDIKLYTEKFYFPLKTSRYFREFDPEKSANPKIKNAGFSKKTVPNAGNPIVLSNFMDVWASHVNDMSMYHAFALPLEDFTRVYNYSSTAGGYDSVQQYIKNAYGAQANMYIERLLTDLNGGARVDPTAGIINKFLGLFKKASVFASASVVIQQPSAMARAMAYINPKYFATATPSAMNVAKHKAAWNEVKKYAPVAIIKEMGYFDTGVGRSSVEWIKGDTTFMDKLDDVFSRPAALADELAWVYIWEAVKKEVGATSDLEVGSEEFLRKAGERFTEVVTNTQVYDSVLSRSGVMRSKDTGMKMATAFMAEPITTLNMMVDGIIQGKRGNKKFTASTVGAVAAQIVLNSALVAIVYAARDDDEDETYLEKYLGSLTSELLDGFNPIGYIPFVKDIWSIAQGYDVERSDMSVINNLWKAVEGMFSEDSSGLEKVLDMAGSISSLFGLPAKNLIRDAEAIYNLFKMAFDDIKTTGAGIGYSIADSFKETIPLLDKLTESKTDSDKLYEAILSGNQTQIDRIKSKFEDDGKVESAIKKGLRENDPRIKEAAQAKYDGDIAEYDRIFEEIISEGNFDKDIVKAAIKAEVNSLEDDDDESSSEGTKETSRFDTNDYFTAIANGDTATANKVKEDLINTAIANGKSREDAESSVYSSFRTNCRDAYADGSLSRDKAMNMLVSHGGLDSNDAYWEMKRFDYYAANGTTDGYSKYTSFHEAVRTGSNLKTVIKEYTDHGVSTQTLASQITSYYKPLYIEMTKSERAGIKGYLLNAYALLGYNRLDKSKDIDKWLED